ncbi:hypothetical protein K492DRAFT_134714 [Lichtheimia hyalospora FSU 10163]|nr:hypothetical protein K492DRAFT_134714 [Lichtheimia hyalospora FSU 10163]
MVKVEEGGGDTRGEWIHQAITTFFESDWKLWGNEASYYSQCPWEEMDIGHYEFPFALKFPNVNYPPSMEDPAGFAIRYVWTAQADGPALQSGIKSREYITPYRPIIISTPDKEWTYRKTLMKDKKHAIAEVQAKLYKQSYCPDEPFEMQLNMTTLHADAKIAAIEYKFRKHHEGKMLVQQGTAFREHIRTVIHSTVPIPSSNTHHGTQVAETVIFDVPTRLVSPSFCSRHTRVHYGLQFLVTIEQGHLFKNTTVVDFSIPIIIANLPHDNLLRIPDLTVIQGYRESKECPMFFDPSLDEPPSPSMNNGPLSTPMNEEPPNYYTLPIQPPQFQLGKERKERTVFLTRPAKGALHSQDMYPAVIIQGLFDEDW